MRKQRTFLWVFLLGHILTQGCGGGSNAADTDSVPTNDSVTESETDDSTTESGSDTDSDSDTDTGTESIPEPVTNEWIFIEGGTFNMGSEDEDIDYAQPVHSVTVPSFEILKTEVTVFQYRQCVDTGVCSTPDTTEEYNCQSELKNNWLVSAHVNYPVCCINQSQAEQYCNWLGGRLLSEAEWEFAARGGGQDIAYPWGDELATCDYAVMMQGDYPGCREGNSLPVCSKTLGNTTHGLCDMAGNFAEWVADLVQITNGYNGAPLDGGAWIQDSDYGVVRGGSSSSSAYRIHVASRQNQNVSKDSNANTTIRCAR